MKGAVLLTALFATIGATMGGCAVMVPGHLYPVSGPLSKQGSPPVYAVSLNGGVSPSGSLSVHLAPGIKCVGAWHAISQKDPSARQMAAQWDEVYGSGYFVANVLGQRTFARSAPTCTNAEKLSLEFLVVEPGEPSSAIGVATDGAGNVFKLTF